MVLGELQIHTQQNKIKTLSFIMHKSQPKVDQGLGIRPETLHLTEEKAGPNLRIRPLLP